MGTQENKALVQEHLDTTFNAKGGASTADRFFAQDARNFGQPSSLEEYKARFSGLLTAFPDWSFTVEDMIAEGDVVAVRLTMHGTYQNDTMPIGALEGIEAVGQPVTVTQTHWFWLRDGKIVDHHANRDDLGMRQQVLAGAVSP